MEENSQSWSQEGEALLLAGQYEQALDVYTRALLLAPDDVLLHHYRSYVFNELGCSQEALGAAGRAVHFNKDFVPAYCNRAYAALRLKQYDEAYSDYMCVFFQLERSPGTALIDLRRTPINRTPALAEPGMAGHQTSRMAMLAYHAQGYVLIQAGLPAEALAAFEQARRFAPLDAVRQQAMLHYDQGAALLRLKRCSEALAALEVACEMNPNAAENRYGVGYALSELGRHAEAVAAFDRAIALDAQLAPAYNDRACSLQALGCYAEALESVEEAIRLDPNLAYPYETRGEILFALQRYEEALASFEEGNARNPNVIFKKASLLHKTLQALGDTAENE